MSGLDDRTSRVLRGIVAGAVAGIAASFVMDRFQAMVDPLLFPEGGGGAEPSTERAADDLDEAVNGRPVAAADKPLAGQSIHYAFGTALGIGYGIAAAIEPRVTIGYGTGFGIAVATVADEGAVPALGLGEPAWRASLADNLYSYVSHLVFGATLEFVRRRVAGTLVDQPNGEAS